MTSPLLVTADDLGLYLNDPEINAPRATAMITDSQLLCESIGGSPLPDGASVVVKRVAGRAYVGTVTTRTAQLLAAGSQVGTVDSGMGGVYLTRADKADLRRLGGGGDAFTINLLADDYTLDVPSWEYNGVVSDVQTS